MHRQSLHSLKSRLQGNKPWAILGISRKEYEARRPWAKAGQSRERFEDLLLALGEHPEVLQDLRDYAEAEALTEMIFGQSGD